MRACMLNHKSEVRAQTQPPQTSLILATVDTTCHYISSTPCGSRHYSVQEFFIDADNNPFDVIEEQPIVASYFRLNVLCKTRKTFKFDLILYTKKKIPNKLLI